MRFLICVCVRQILCANNRIHNEPNVQTSYAQQEMNLTAVEFVPSAFPFHILHILSLCANLQMLGIEASGIVAKVEHHVAVKVSIVSDTIQFGTQTMHQPHTSIVCANSVTLGVYGLGPKVATPACHGLIFIQGFGCVR